MLSQLSATVEVHGARSALPARRVRQIVEHILTVEERVANVQVSFVDAAFMTRLNADWKGHDRPTDVISFTLPQPDGSIHGEIYVCRMVAAQHAAEYGISLREELARLVVHGTLHVLGMDHDEGPARTVSEMWKLQERYVKDLS